MEMVMKRHICKVLRHKNFTWNNSIWWSKRQWQMTKDCSFVSKTFPLPNKTDSNLLSHFEIKKRIKPKNLHVALRQWIVPLNRVRPSSIPFPTKTFISQERTHKPFTEIFPWCISKSLPRYQASWLLYWWNLTLGMKFSCKCITCSKNRIFHVFLCDTDLAIKTC